MATRREIMAMTNRQEAYEAIEEIGDRENWSSHKKASARSQWKAKHEPETINRRTNPQAPRQQRQQVPVINPTMTYEEFQRIQQQLREQDDQRRQGLRQRRRTIINQFRQLADELDRINREVPVNDDECYICLEQTDDELNCGHKLCDGCRRDDLIVNCGICRRQTEFEEN